MAISTGSQAPFPQSCAPNKELLKHSDISIPTPTHLHENDAHYIAHIPGDPAVNLLLNEVRDYLSNQLETPLLDELYDHLWLVPRKSGQNIDALHRQRVKGRSIVPAEDPRLHLVWGGDKIYIKPIPVFLLDHDFWTMYLHPRMGETSAPYSQGLSQAATSAFDRSVALGFLRSYALLVPHRLDFIFIRHFRDLGDESVAKRYHYGQLRLSRLDWAVRIFRPQHTSTIWFCEIPQWSHTDFVARATLPLLFVFASVSLALSSMQVALSVPGDELWPQGLSESGKRDMQRAFWMFSVVVVLLDFEVTNAVLSHHVCA
ncbi:uncharacterized protein BCR38DRAFT_447330 [Pseudomassariella vexata]|uniref:Uncharacterized protein n=1 Tax=Pseudomassariella vexata TaxID=1141098 RepID=A0A1Y2DI13_9PEZI|nr:uncharacterized protein BCR38DRAFT_447330 [Pseudomassariella vexata]ORY58455.1 hypothetical protein BCR38DRAFT_447330 [Pseudomassariella vexata]